MAMAATMQVPVLSLMSKKPMIEKFMAMGNRLGINASSPTFTFIKRRLMMINMTAMTNPMPITCPRAMVSAALLTSIPSPVIAVLKRFGRIFSISVSSSPRTFLS
ncbi:hypothetical protein ES708_33744 [subsurface metagenome]